MGKGITPEEFLSRVREEKSRLLVERPTFLLLHGSWQHVYPIGGLVLAIMLEAAYCIGHGDGQAAAGADGPYDDATPA